MDAQLALLAEHGYAGVVAWSGWADVRRAALIPCGMGRVLRPGEATPLARRHRDEGLDFTTLHVGTGFESDAEMDALAAAVLDASAVTGHPLHVETHRATMTQDARRTMDLLGRFPGLSLTLDFSHWHVGHEMTYADEFDARLETMTSVFTSVRSLQLRLATSGRIQAAVDPATAAFADYVNVLDRCLRVLLRVCPDATISCAPELLPAKLPNGRLIHYADDPEVTDRFVEALALSQLCEDRFAAAVAAA